MSIVPIKIWQIGKTKVNREEVRKWLDYMGAVNYQIPSEDEASDAAILVSLAGRSCYKSFEPGLNPNVTKIRKDLVDYFDNVLKSGHGSILEHAVFSYAMDGVSRVFTAEMNRHRAGMAISERSLRFYRFGDDIPWWLPLSFRPNVGDDADLLSRKERSKALFERAFKNQEAEYREFLDIWDMDASHHNFHYKKVVTSAGRRIVGMGVATGGVWTGNVRALRHIITMRTDPAAEEEIAHVFSRIAELIVADEPHLFGDFAECEKGVWKPKYRKV